MERIRIAITGESGSGLLSVGEIVTRGLMALGYEVIADREYPSLIKGGHSRFQINAAAGDINSLSNRTDVMVCLDRQSMDEYLADLSDGGVLVHAYERLAGIADELAEAEARGVRITHLQGREVAEEQGGNVLFQNMVLTGMLWKVLGFDYEVIAEQVRWKFADKPKLLEIDLRCLAAGFERVEKLLDFPLPAVKAEKRLFIDGNEALALGAVEAGVEAFVAYPMSPSSTILTHLANMAAETGMYVKQVEDEISVANMALGSMFMGKRTLAATSGGGIDLMAETISLAGIVENPLVLINAQRPGPGTGLPTWTAQGDLNLAMHVGHGEFGRMVMAVSDPEDCYRLVQEAFNWAETFQLPLILLTEKVIAESKWTVPEFKKGLVKIERGLVEGEDLKKLENSDRYKITESGVSKRWLPGSSSEAYYFANGDEHWEDGSLEEGERAGEMYAKRLRKLETLRAALPDPEVLGVAKGAEISFVGFGSSRNVMRDVIAEAAEQGVKVNYLHFSYLWPLKVERLHQFFAENSNVWIIEGNATGQLERLIKMESGLEFQGNLRKWNGRPFFVEEVLNATLREGEKERRKEGDIGI